MRDDAGIRGEANYLFRSTPISRQEFFAETLEPLYFAQSWNEIGYDRIALLFSVLAVGVLLDFKVCGGFRVTMVDYINWNSWSLDIGKATNISNLLVAVSDCMSHLRPCIFVLFTACKMQIRVHGDTLSGCVPDACAYAQTSRRYS